MKKILIALNSFKECASSVELSFLTKNLFLETPGIKENNIVVKPLSDGGDGFLVVVTRRFDLKKFAIPVSFPFDDEQINCSVAYSSQEKTVYIETAEILGLGIIPPEKRKPLELSSKGLGEILQTLKTLAEKGNPLIDKAVVGIGGTATSDLGLGALSKLGLKLFDKNGKELAPLPNNFLKTESIDFDNLTQLPFELELVLDVENELLGVNGANRLFAAQKGARDNEIETLEKGFEKIISLLPKNILEGKRLSGAGGGLAAGLKIFYNAKYKYAEEFILRDLSLTGENSNFDLVITGEGKLDNQTGLRKGVQIIIEEYSKYDVPVVVIAGAVENFPEYENVDIVELRNYFTSDLESIMNYEEGFRKATEYIKNKYFNV